MEAPKVLKEKGKILLSFSEIISNMSLLNEIAERHGYKYSKYADMKEKGWMIIIKF